MSVAFRVLPWVLALTFALSRDASAQPSDAGECSAAYESAQRHRLHDELLDARRDLNRCTQSECHALIRGDCAQWSREIEAELPSMIFQVRTASGQEIIDARILVDGSEVTPGGDGAMSVDPGERIVRVEYKGRSSEKPVKIVRGDKRLVVRIVFPGDVPAAQQEEARVEPPPPPPPPRRFPVGVWVLAGASAVSLGGALYFGVDGLSDLSALRRACAPYCSHAEKDAALRKLVAADVLVGLGVVSAGVSAAWFLWGARSADARDSAFDFHIERGAALASFRRTF